MYNKSQLSRDKKNARKQVAMPNPFGKDVPYVKPIVSQEGFKQGPPPADSKYRIMGEDESTTLYNPTPYAIAVEGPNGSKDILNPFDTTLRKYDEPYMDEKEYEDDGEYMDLTDEEIEQYRAGGYVVDDLSQQDNGGVYSQDIPYPPKHNPANSFAVNDPRSMQKGGVKPYVTSDLDDFIYRQAAYNDSLWLYQNNLNPLREPVYNHNLTGAYVKKSKPFKRPGNAYESLDHNRYHPQYQSPIYKRNEAAVKKNPNIKKIPRNEPIYNDAQRYFYHRQYIDNPFTGTRYYYTAPGDDYSAYDTTLPRYKKPVQPVQFKKPDSTKPTTSNKPVSSTKPQSSQSSQNQKAKMVQVNYPTSNSSEINRIDENGKTVTEKVYYDFPENIDKSLSFTPPPITDVDYPPIEGDVQWTNPTPWNDVEPQKVYPKTTVPEFTTTKRFDSKTGKWVEEPFVDTTSPEYQYHLQREEYKKKNSPNLSPEQKKRTARTLNLEEEYGNKYSSFADGGIPKAQLGLITSPFKLPADVKHPMQVSPNKPTVKRTGRTYDALNDVKPTVAESTKPNIAPVDKNITEKAIAQKAAERKIVAKEIKNSPMLTKEQKAEILMSPQKLDENIYLAYQKEPETLKAAKEYSTMDKIENIVRNPLVAATYAMQPGDFNMPMNYSEFERSPEYDDPLWNRNAVGQAANFARYFTPVGLAASLMDNAIYTRDDIEKALESGKAEDWKQAGYSGLNTALDLIGSRYIGNSGRLLNTGERATLNAMNTSNRLGLNSGVNNYLSTRVFPNISSQVVRSADNLPITRLFPQINPSAATYNPLSRTLYNQAVTAGNVQNASQAVRESLPAATSNFESAIDWSNWNPQTLKHPELINEYNAIEEASKANGTWMKNPDGTPYVPSKEALEKGLGEHEFIMTQSKRFKESYPEGFETMHRGYSYNNFEELAKQYPEGRSVFGGDRNIGMHYASNNPERLHTVIHPKSTNSLEFEDANSWREIGVDPNLGIQNTWGGEPGAFRSGFYKDPVTGKMTKGQYVSTDDLASHLEKNKLNYAKIKDLFDGVQSDYVTILNQQLGNYAKSLVGNVGFYDLNNPNIYDNILETIAKGEYKFQDGGIKTLPEVTVTPAGYKGPTNLDPILANALLNIPQVQQNIALAKGKGPTVQGAKAIKSAKRAQDKAKFNEYANNQMLAKADWERRSSGAAQPVDEVWQLPLGLRALGTIGAIDIPYLGASVGELANLGAIGYGTTELPGTAKSWYDYGKGDVSLREALGKTGLNALDFLGARTGYNTAKNLIGTERGLMSIGKGFKPATLTREEAMANLSNPELYNALDRRTELISRDPAFAFSKDAKELGLRGIGDNVDFRRSQKLVKAANDEVERLQKLYDKSGTYFMGKRINKDKALANELLNATSNKVKTNYEVDQFWKQRSADRLRLPINLKSTNKVGEGAFTEVYPTTFDENTLVKIGNVPEFETPETMQHIVNVGKELNNPRLGLPYKAVNFGEPYRAWNTDTQSEFFKPSRLYAQIMPRVPGRPGIPFNPSQQAVEEYIDMIKELEKRNIHLDYVNPQNTMYDDATDQFSIIDVNTTPYDDNYFLDIVNNANNWESELRKVYKDAMRAPNTASERFKAKADKTIRTPLNFNEEFGTGGSYVDNQMTHFQPGGSLNKRILKRYPGMQNVYGEQGENLNIIKDPNFSPSDSGVPYGDIEFIHPGTGKVTYLAEDPANDVIYQSPTPDKYTAVYNPRGANKHDVFLDMMHGMRNDPEYMKLLDEFKTESKKSRSNSMDHWYNYDVENYNYIDGREAWDNNYIDGLVRAHLAKKGMGRHSFGAKDYKMERQGSTPEMYNAADNIYKYLKGKQNGGNTDPGNNALELHMFYDKDVYKQDGGQYLNLTDTEIEEYRKGGYVVEELPTAQFGMNFKNRIKKVFNQEPTYPTNQQLSQFLNPEYQRVTEGREVTLKPSEEQLSSTYNDFMYSKAEAESDQISKRASDCFSESGYNCAQSAFSYYDKYVAPKLPGGKSSWQLKEAAGMFSGKEGANPSYNEAGESWDSWDLAGGFKRKQGKLFFTAKDNNNRPLNDKFKDMNQTQIEQYYRDLKLPIGTIINGGGADNDDSFRTMAGDTGKGYNTEQGLSASNHTTIVVGYDRYGTPYIFDEGKIHSIADPEALVNIMGITNVITPKENIGYTYDKIKKGKTWNQKIDKLSLNLPGTGKLISDIDEMKPFMSQLEKNKTQMMNTFGLTNDEYDEYAKRAVATALTETKGGMDWGTFRYGIVPSYLTDKMGIGESQGITQINPEAAIWGHTKDSGTDWEYRNPGLVKKLDELGISEFNYDPWNPNHQAIVTMGLLQENKKLADIKFKEVKGNNEKLSDPAKGYYMWNSPRTVYQGEAQGDNINVKRFMEYYDMLNMVNKKEGGDVKYLTQQEIDVLRAKGYRIVEE